MDRIPPQNIEAEQSLLSSAMLDPSTMAAVEAIIRTEDFYRTTHQVAWQAAIDLARGGSPVDLVTLCGRLKETGMLERAGGSAYLSEIIDKAPIASNAPQYARIIREASIRRQLIEHGNAVIRSAFEGAELKPLIDSCQQKAMSITLPDGDGAAKISELCHLAMDRYEGLKKQTRRITGISTGFSDLDWMTCGLQRGDLVVLAARPSMGKSSLALCMTRNAAKEVPVAWFSLEMTRHQLTDAMIAQESMLDRQALRRGTFSDDDWIKITDANSRIYSLPILFDDEGDHDIADIRMRAREMKRKHGAGLFIIDHLQIVRTAGKRSRNDEIGEITRQCKAMAKELDVPIVLLSQLNRSLEQRNNPYKRPVLSDLRDSGNIEQDADVVLFLYRPEVYGDGHSWPDLEKGPKPFEGQAEINIAKQRNGPTGMVLCKWHPESTRFFPVDEKHLPGA